MDISPEMLQRAREKGLAVSRGSVTQLPFPADTFDLVFSYKTLPHVPGVEEAVREMARVTAPGGHMIAEFYNPASIRGIVRRLRSPLATGPGWTDKDVFYRSDRPRHVHDRLIPPDMKLKAERGIRILTPAPFILRIPGVGGIVMALERALADRVPRLGGFYSVVAEKRGG